MSYGAPRTIEIAKGVEYTYPAVPCEKHGGSPVTSANKSGPCTTAWFDIDGSKLVMKDVAAELGVAPNTIRYYVQHGLLDGSQPPKPRKKSRW
jgi:hypothetical protein